MMSTFSGLLSPGSGSFPPHHPPNHPQARASEVSEHRGYRRRSAGHNPAVPKIVVRLTADEVAVLCSCINETLDALDDTELADRVGVDRPQARALLGMLSERRAEAKRAAADA
jgi:hypothetical protein